MIFLYTFTSVEVFIDSLSFTSCLFSCAGVHLCGSLSAGANTQDGSPVSAEAKNSKVGGLFLISVAVAKPIVTCAIRCVNIVSLLIVKAADITSPD